MLLECTQTSGLPWAARGAPIRRRRSGNIIDAPLTFSPYWINGGYYYGKISVKF